MKFEAAQVINVIKYSNAAVIAQHMFFITQAYYVKQNKNEPNQK